MAGYLVFRVDAISDGFSDFLSGGQRPKGAGRRCEGAPAPAGAPIPSSQKSLDLKMV